MIRSRSSVSRAASSGVGRNGVEDGRPSSWSPGMAWGLRPSHRLTAFDPLGSCTVTTSCGVCPPAVGEAHAVFHAQRSARQRAAEAHAHLVDGEEAAPFVLPAVDLGAKRRSSGARCRGGRSGFQWPSSVCIRPTETLTASDGAHRNLQALHFGDLRFGVLGISKATSAMRLRLEASSEVRKRASWPTVKVLGRSSRRDCQSTSPKMRRRAAGPPRPRSPGASRRSPVRRDGRLPARRRAEHQEPAREQARERPSLDAKGEHWAEATAAIAVCQTTPVPR